MKGITDYFRALRYIFHRKIILFAMIPGIFAMLFSGGVYFLVKSKADDLGNWVISWWTWDWGREAVEAGSAWVGGFIMVVISLVLFKYFILIVSSPFMSPLSERLEQLLTGQPANAPVTARMMIQGLMRGIRITLRNIFRELSLTILLLILGFFPLFSPFTGVAILLVQAFYAGFGNMDFTMERFYSVRESVRFVGSNKIYTIGNGLVFVGLLLIPFAGALVAVPLGAAAGTIGVIERR